MLSNIFAIPCQGRSSLPYGVEFIISRRTSLLSKSESASTETRGDENSAVAQMTFSGARLGLIF